MGGLRYPSVPQPTPLTIPRYPSTTAGGVVLACSNWVAGSLSDLTVARGWGNIGCFLGGAVACALSMAALALFSWRGELGRDDLLPAAAGPFKPAAA